MYKSHIALLLSAALGNAQFLAPNRGANLAVNEAFTLQWETDGLVEPLSVNLVPSGPGDFVVAQQVAVDIENSGELEFTPDVSIANFDAFQFSITDAEGNTVDSEPFSIDGLTEEPVLATVTLENVETVVATEDGAVVTSVATSVEEAVASVPADPIRLAISAGEVVNEVLTAPVTVQSSSSSSSSSDSDSETQSETETETESDDGFSVAGGVAEEGAVQVQQEFVPGTPASAEFIAAGQAAGVALNPGDPGFVDFSTLVGQQQGGGAAAPLNIGAGAGVNVLETAVDSALVFEPLETAAPVLGGGNSLVVNEPAVEATAQVGEIAQDGVLSFDPVASVAEDVNTANLIGGGAVGGLAPVNTDVAGTALATASVADAITEAGAAATGIDSNNLVGGVGDNGAVTFDPLATDAAGFTDPIAAPNTLAPTLGSPTIGAPNPGGIIPDSPSTGAPLVPNDPNSPNNGAPLDPNNPVQTGLPGAPLGGGVGGGFNNTNPNVPNGGLQTGTDGIVIPAGPTGVLGGRTTLQTNVLGGTGVGVPSSTGGLTSQPTDATVEINGAGSMSRNVFVGGVVAIAAAMLL